MAGAGAGEVGAIVVAAGRGDRFGAAKQFLELEGSRLVDRAVVACSDSCDAVVVVLPADVAWDGPAVHAAVSGGATRSDSVRAGLAALPPTVDVVLVHDAARPLASRAIFDAVIDAIRVGADAAVPALPVPDTLKRVDGARVTETVARDDLVAVQTPQAFRIDALRAAHAGDGRATDDAALVEQRGGCVVVVPGEVTNFKITAPSDLALAAAFLAARRRDAVNARVGLGFDVHPFTAGRPLVLGGVTIEGAAGLAGHSDADVVAHAVADALLGAAGQPDLGTLFPASEDEHAGASSIGFLEGVAARLRAEGFTIVNVDVVIAAETPRLAPHLGAMAANLARALAAAGHGDDPVPVSVKPKRAEGLGAIGRAEGIAAWAVALVERGIWPESS